MPHLIYSPLDIFGYFLLAKLGFWYAVKKFH